MLAARNLKRISKYNILSQIRKKSTYEEVQIPVPWGHISGKWWGPQDKRPILTLHGWQDNCGSFDLLIPILPSDLSYLAIDLPGHGLSSQIPPGMFYHSADSIMLLRRIQEFFEWPKISLMGHSLGAILGFTFGFHFPKLVDFCVCIDGLHPLIHPGNIKRSVRTIEEFMKYDQLNSSSREPPTYTLDEIAEKLHKGTRQSIDLDKCKYIFERNIRPSKQHPGKYFFSRDARLKCGPLHIWHFDDLKMYAEAASFPIFCSKAEEGPFFNSEEYYPTILEILKRVSKDLVFVNVSGAHHGHLNHPEIFKELIPDFLRKHAVETTCCIGGLRDDIRCKGN